MRRKNGNNKDKSYEEIRHRICRRNKIETKESDNVQMPKRFILLRTSTIFVIT